MIKRFLFLASLLTCIPTLGQNKQLSPAWAFTAFVHGNLSTIPEYREIYIPNAHGAFGIYAAYRMRPKYDIRFGLKVNTIAYSRNAVDSFEIFIQRIREYSIDLPISVFYYPGRTERTWGFFAGITPGILINKFVSQTEINPKYANIPSDPSKPGRVDIGFHGGASLKLSPRFSVAASYTHSVSNFQIEPYNSGRFSQFEVGLGFQINVPGAKDSEKELAKREEIIPFKRQSFVLLVRLKTEGKRIRMLKNSGYNLEAQELEEKVNAENELTIDAFRKGFTFSEVRFFYDSLSTQIAEERYEGALFDENRVFSDSILNDTTDILIAEFGSPYSEAFGSTSGYGLVIYDYSFNQMKAPFPYYVSTHYGLVSRKEAVIRFDERLREYLKMR